MDLAGLYELAAELCASKGQRELDRQRAERTDDRPLDIDALLDDPARGSSSAAASGGVGKTTTAAALGVRAAERGRDVVVLTVDPARRLAQALGLTSWTTPRARSSVDGRAASCTR